MSTILIIDDEEQMRTTLSRLLERSGYEVITAANGEEGLELFNEKKIDLIVTDIIMPEKEGLETIMDLKKNSPDVKIIAISGGGRNDANDYLPLAKHFGAQRIISKPFAKDDFLNVVEEVLKL